LHLNGFLGLTPALAGFQSCIQVCQTKLSKPHFAPEICVKVTMLNFMVTEDGLLDQMLNIVVKFEDPKNMEKRN
jgi:ABC-type polysaccharide transport system permease subunit